MIKDRSNPGGVTAIIHGKWKLIDNGTGLELYDIHTDPHEHTNLMRDAPGRRAGPAQADARTQRRGGSVAVRLALPAAGL